MREIEFEKRSINVELEVLKITPELDEILDEEDILIKDGYITKDREGKIFFVYNDGFIGIGLILKNYLVRKDGKYYSVYPNEMAVDLWKER